MNESKQENEDEKVCNKASAVRERQQGACERKMKF